MHERPAKFFEDGMLPPGFVFNDPSHIGENMLIPFFEHVIKMETPSSPDIAPRHFRFYQFERGSGENRRYYPAVYNGVVEPAAPCRIKKAVTVPEFEDPPSSVASSSNLLEDAPTSPLPTLPPIFAPLASMFTSDLEAARAEVRAEMAAEAATQEDVCSAPDTIAVTQTITTSRPQRAATASKLTHPQGASIPWLNAEFDAANRDSDDESELTEEEYSPPTDDDGEDSDDEVEDVLNDLDLLDAMVPAASTAVSTRNHNPVPNTSEPRDTSTSFNMGSLPSSPTTSTGRAVVTAAPTPVRLPAPAGIRADADARLSFLIGLSDEREYAALLHRSEYAVRIQRLRLCILRLMDHLCSAPHRRPDSRPEPCVLGYVGLHLPACSGSRAYYQK